MEGPTPSSVSWLMQGGGPRRRGYLPNQTGIREDVAVQATLSPYGDGGTPVVSTAFDGVLVGGQDGVASVALPSTDVQRVMDLDSVGADIPRTALLDGLLLGVTSETVAAHDLETNESRWRVSPEFGVGNHLLTDTGVFLAHSGSPPARGLTALSRANGNVMWEAPAVSAAGGIAAEKNTLYTAGWDGVFRALNAETGEGLWERSLGGTLRGVAVGDERVFTSNSEGVHAFDPETGEQLWTFATSATQYSSPAVDDERIYFGSWDRGVLYAVDKTDGMLEWRFGTADTEGGIFGSPTVCAETVYAPHAHGAVYAFDRESGERLWRFDHDEDVTSNVVPTDRGLLFTTGSASVQASTLYLLAPASEVTEPPSSSGTDAQSSQPGVDPVSSNSPELPDWLNLTSVTGVVLGAGGGLALAVYLGRQQSEDAESHTASTSTDRSAAEQAARDGDAARQTGDFVTALDEYTAAQETYRRLRAQRSAEDDDRDDIDDALASLSDAVDETRRLQEAVGELTTILSVAESDLLGAVMAHVDGQGTVARHQYRQAKNQYERALDLLAEVEADTGEALLSLHPITVTDETPRVTPLSDVSLLPDLTEGNSLAEAGLTSREAFENASAAEREDVSPVHLLVAEAWWNDGIETTFDSREQVETRRDATVQGMDLL